MFATTVTLKWDDNSTDEDAFVIERSVNSDTNWFPVATVQTDVVTWTDITTAVGQRYYYRVYAMNAAGNSAPSNTVSILIVEGMPSNVTIRIEAK